MPVLSCTGHARLYALSYDLQKAFQVNRVPNHSPRLIQSWHTVNHDAATISALHPHGGSSAQAHLQQYLEGKALVDGLLPAEVLHHCCDKVPGQAVALFFAACTSLFQVSTSTAEVYVLFLPTMSRGSPATHQLNTEFVEGQAKLQLLPNKIVQERIEFILDLNICG